MKASRCVHIIDDEAEVRDALTLLLSTAQIESRSYGSAEEYLTLNPLNEPACLLLDNQLPGMSGIELLRQIVAATKDSTVIMITAYGDVPTAVSALDSEVSVIHASGPKNFAQANNLVENLKLANYQVEPYLDSEAIANAYVTADLVVCRSGGTLAELAMFGLPSVLVPLPTSADDHQLHNAKEFESMQAATIAEQEPAPYSGTVQAIRGAGVKARTEAITGKEDNN